MNADYSNPTRECDLVMKGGVTSGIVYPPVVLKLAENQSDRSYRFRNIGGTSAGAIAAAVTAAAEYKREDGGFERLKEVSDELSKGTFLRDLFQPSKETKPLMNILLYILTQLNKKEKGNLGWWLQLILGLPIALLSNDLITFVIGALLGVGLSFVVALLTNGSLSGRGLILPVLLGSFGGMIGVGFDLLKILFKKVPENFFGICSGRGGSDVLTNWLSRKINEIAGLPAESEPLTFGQLSSKKIGQKDVSITLKMVTSNLSHNQPYLLPFDKHSFLFKEEEFNQLFPENIVSHLKKHAHNSKRCTPPPGYYFLPDPENLPVVVATRMSLSFPVLLSAVPLYTISQAAYKGKKRKEPINLEEQHLQKNWFSDGGISSNFPIHFFDAWLPGRPTFGVNLTSMPKEDNNRVNTAHLSALSDPASLENEPDSADIDKICESIYLPKANDQSAPAWVSLEKNLLAFILAIFSTAQNYRDTMQSMLPSYRERIVQIRLDSEEGGLNLAMEPPTIKKMVDKGEFAGEKLGSFNFNLHQWVRFRVLMGLMESMLQDMEKVLENQQFDYESLLEQSQLESQEEKFPYRHHSDTNWVPNAKKRVEAMRKLVQQDWPPPPFFAVNPPLPKPVLRVTPEL